MRIPDRRIWLLASQEVPHFSSAFILRESLNERGYPRGVEKFERRYKSGEYTEYGQKLDGGGGSSTRIQFYTARMELYLTVG